MHRSILDFLTKFCTPARIAGKRVLEVGSLNVNGSARDIIEPLSPAAYHGVDIRPQNRYVDEVLDATALAERFGPESWDVVVSTEMLEHAEDWRASIEAMKSVLTPGGLIIITCRGPGFPLHAYPHDFWRFRTDDFAAMFTDFGALYLSDDPDPHSPGVIYAGMKGAIRHQPAPDPMVIPWHSREACEHRLAKRREKPIPPEPFACFYHVACMGNWKDVVTEQIEALSREGISPRVIMLGTQADEDWLSANLRVGVTIRHESLTNYETPTLQAAWEWARENPTGAVMYLHTKGVSAPEDLNKPAWRRLMMHFVVEDWRANLDHLAVADMVGVNWQNSPKYPHFSGNFWMARADWLASLQSPNDYRAKGGPMLAEQPWERMHAEVWIGSQGWHLVESLCCSDTNLWRGPEVFGLLEIAITKRAGDEWLETWVAAQSGSVLDLRGRDRWEVEKMTRIDADVVVLTGVLEQLCNGGAGQILMNMNHGKWRKLVVSTAPGTNNHRRRGVSPAKPAPIDVEATGLIRGKPEIHHGFAVYER